MKVDFVWYLSYGARAEAGAPARPVHSATVGAKEGRAGATVDKVLARDHCGGRTGRLWGASEARWISRKEEWSSLEK